MMKHIPIPADAEIAATQLNVLKGLPNINIYRIIAAYTPTCFIPWVDLVKGLYQCEFDMRLKEMAILRQAYRAHSAYEMHQHRFIALQNGVTEAEIKVIMSEGKVTSLDDEANFICQVADEMETTATLTDATYNELISRYSLKTAMEIIVTLAFYCCVARVLNSTRIPVENDNPLQGRANPL